MFARLGNCDVDFLDDTRGPRGEHHDTITEKERFLDIVRHEQDCRTFLRDDIEQIRLHGLARHRIEEAWV